MPSVTITITDKIDGSVQVEMDFDPPLEKDQPNTAAQLAAAMLMQVMQENSIDGNLHDVEINGEARGDEVQWRSDEV